jgi:GWxTD domain-containing protein
MTMNARDGRRLRRPALLALFVLLACQPLVAQVEMSGPVPDARGLFTMDAIAFAGTGSESRLDVFVQVGYDALTFVKREELYDASYEMTVTLSDSAGGLVSEKMWTEEVKGASFDQSVSSSAFRVTQRMFQVQPGEYRLTAAIRDQESKMVRRIETRIPVTDFSLGKLAVSDIFLLARVSQKGDLRSIAPNVTSNVGDIPDAFYFYIELYNRASLDSVRLISTVLNEKKSQALEVDTLVALHPGKNEKILRIPHGILPLGDYRLFVRAFPANVQGAPDTGYLAVTNRVIIVRWRGMPRSLKDLDLAIEQVRYIAKDDEYSVLKEAKTPEEKQTKFLEFWKKRDPNPNTPRNERMEEYYQRVEYADKHFGHYQPGWRTDMGMVYLIFGPPSSVERHPFDIDAKPYEVWTYYDISYSFVFLDETGFGDYRLVTPLWEVYNRVRR